jgi:multicomponent Na+:H+ antiporter subunit D
VLSLLVLVPLAGLMLLSFPFGARLRKWATVLAPLLPLSQIILVVFGPAGFWSGSGGLDRFCDFGLKADDLSLVMLLSIGIVVFVTLLVVGELVEGDRQRFSFTNVLVVALIGMNGTVLLSDVFSLYVFIEITTVSSFVLIAFNREKNALEGAFKYIMLSAVATVLMVTSVALLLLVAHGTSFSVVREALQASGSNVLVKIAVGAFICGLFIKGGLVPFHGWVPDAYSAAPAPVSVLLAGISTKATGIYALIRLVAHVFAGSQPLNHVLLFVGVVSIVVGALAALGQRDMKRMLAYSSISQVGYIVLGVGCGTPLGMVGAVFHLFNHAVFKSLLFVNSAALEQRLGTTDMNQMGGLGSRMPFTGATSVLATLSTAGIPPLSGFWSKLIIIVALWQAGYLGYAVLAILMSVVTLAYLLGMQRRVFFGKVPEALAQATEASFGLVVASVVLAGVTVGVGVLFPWLFNTFLLPVSGIL